MTREELAEALDCFWNAAVGAAHDRQDFATGAIVGCIAEGINAVSLRLKEQSLYASPPAEPVTPEMIAAAWHTWHSRDGGLGPPDPAFVEAIKAAVAAAPAISETDLVEAVARSIANADDEDYMEDHARFDKRARFAIATMLNAAPQAPATDAVETLKAENERLRKDRDTWKRLCEDGLTVEAAVDARTEQREAAVWEEAARKMSKLLTQRTNLPGTKVGDLADALRSYAKDKKDEHI